MATTECRFGGGLNSSSGGELKLYLKWKRNTFSVINDLRLVQNQENGSLCMGSILLSSN